MPKKEYVVRVVIHDPTDEVALLMEQLRYAGCVKLLRGAPRDQANATPVFDLHAPKGTADTQVWSRHSADRMQSFGYNAVVAPAWEDWSDPFANSAGGR